jgi:hypothetical protein
VVPAAITSGQSLYTLFTSMFVHGSLTHIAFNMLYLLAFGDNVEDRLGRERYLVFYVLSGLLAAFAQIAAVHWLLVCHAILQRCGFPWHSDSGDWGRGLLGARRRLRGRPGAGVALQAVPGPAGIAAAGVNRCQT